MRFVRDATITVIILIVVVWVVMYSRVRAGGLSAESQPGTVERVIAANLMRLSIPRDSNRHENPFRADLQAWRSAADHFEDHCANCHGADGRGGTVTGQGMYPKVPDLSQPVVQQLRDGELFYIIQNGVRWTGMPAWKLEHSPEETWRLVSFVRKVPTLTPDDIDSISHESGWKEQEHGHDQHGQHGRGQYPPDR